MAKRALPEAEWKAQIAGETRARVAAEDRAVKAEARAEKAEHAARELSSLLRQLTDEIEALRAHSQSLGYAT
jgi:predicted RNase H-like nuclease (RuvC/YqgF family)